MPPSAIGVSSTRCSPYLRCSPSVTAEHAAEIADVLAHDDHARVALEHDVHRGVERLDHVHVRHGISLPSPRIEPLLEILGPPILARAGRASLQLCALPQQVRRHLLIHVLEHGARVERRTLGEGAVAHRLLPAGASRAPRALLQRRVPLFRPLAEGDQVLLQALDRIAQRPCLPFVLRAIARRIIARRMRSRRDK